MRTERFRQRAVFGLALAALLLSGCTDVPEDRRVALTPHVVTDVQAQTELFVEFAPLVAGEPSVFAAHFTRLSDYSPIAEGALEVVLSGGDAPSERFRVRAPRAPGIFAPTVLPRATGERSLSLVLTAPDLEASHLLGTITVHVDRTAARASPAPAAPEGEIGLYKEQQWGGDFGVEAVTERSLRDSVRALARVRAAPDREYLMSAPVGGRIEAEGRFPAIGLRVERGDVLARLSPRLGEGVDRAALQAELTAAQSAADLAQGTHARMQRLFSQHAVARRRLDESEAEQRAAQARLLAARQRLQSVDAGAGGIELRAPIGGELAGVQIGPGAAVDAGAPLFHIVDRSELWLQAQVAEADVARLGEPTGAWLKFPGLPEPFELVPGLNGRVVGVGGALDPASRSLPVLLALAPPPPGLVLNQQLEVQLLSGHAIQRASVPSAAVIDDGGERVVYVMRGGESFSRVVVRTGLRDGDYFELIEGPAVGERVVSRGALQVRRAAATPEAMGHGHAH